MIVKVIEILINSIYRMVYGIIGIYFFNKLLQLAGVGLMVGLNGWTVALTGVLGIPGVVLLFAISLVGGI